MLLVSSCVYLYLFVILGVTGQMMLGLGQWSILSVDQCENDAEMPWRLRVHWQKLNSTHDAFDVDASTLDVLDDSYGIRINTCKMTDGECKHIMNMMDKNMRRFLRFCAREKVEGALTAAGIDPPDLPIPMGDYHLQNFLVNTDDLSKIGVHGEFVSQNYLVKDGQDVACLQVSTKFDPFEDPDS